MKLDIGGGTSPRDGWVNLDPEHGEGEWKRRLQDGIPCEDNTVDEAYASHVMEHIPAGAERIFCMNEVNRVLKPGGKFTVRVPLFPTWQAIADPTHVSFWVRESFLYFTEDAPQNADYGIVPWDVMQFGVASGWEGVCILRKKET